MRNVNYYWVLNTYRNTHLIVRNLAEAKKLLKDGKVRLVHFETISPNDETVNCGILYKCGSQLMKYDENKGKSRQIKW